MKEVIKSSGMSLKEFAEYYEIPYNTVRQWYNEEREAPKYIKKLIEENLNLKTKGQQLTIEENIDEEFLKYEKILKNYGIITPKMIAWNNDKYIEVTKYEEKIIINYGTIGKETKLEIKEEKTLIKAINNVFK